ncbi:MAG: hypothetical protein H8K03_11195 [Nitrospira sp.]
MRILCALPFALLAGVMVAGCADDSYSGRRPAPGYDNVNPGTPQPGQQHRYDEPTPNSQRDPYSRQPGYY